MVTNNEEAIPDNPLKDELTIIKVQDGAEEAETLRCGTFDVDVIDMIKYQDEDPELAIIEQVVDFVSNEENGAAGLAAPQVGVINAWFVMKMGRDGKVVTIINPEIIARSGKKQRVEGCFSESNRAIVKRSREIIANFYTLERDSDGRYYTEYHKLQKIEGWDACVFQHEYDHLKGVLICEKKGSKVLKNDT